MQFLVVCKSPMMLILQISLFSLVMAQQSPFEDNPADWLFRIVPVRNPVPSPCLLRSPPTANRDDYTYTPGIGGHKVHTLATTWPEARRICEQEGGHLAIINSIAESNAVADLWRKAGTVHGGTGSTDFAMIGFHDLFQEGEYITIHGETVAKAGFTQWAPGQPDNLNGVEHCGSLHKNGGLNDLTCKGKYAFICEIPIHHSSSINEFPIIKAQ